MEPIALRRNSQGVFGVSGMPSSSAQTYLLHQLSSPDIRSGGLWLVKSPMEAKKLAALYSFWSQGNPPLIPIVPEDRNRPAILWHLMHSERRLIFFPVDLLDESVVSPESFIGKILRIKRGLRFKPGDLSQQLVLLGYEMNTSANAPGIFARRGNIVDIFPLNSQQPIRCVFGDNDIEELSEFDSRSGSSIRSLASVHVIPARIEQFEPDGRWLDYIRKSRDSGISFIYSDPDELESSTPVWSEVEGIVQNRSRLVFFPLPTSDAMNILETTAAPLYHGNHRALLEDMRLWEKEQFTICFPDTLKKDIEQIWGKNRKKEAVVPATFLPATLLEGHAEGFIWPEQKMVYLTEMGVRGQPQKELPIKKRMVDLHFIDELKPGDYVVHIDHGIGQFRGSAVNTVDGIEKEYFLLEYAEGDKLSVPVELAYKMDKYIGSVTPKIHRLSNTTWKQLTRRIKEEAKKIASELLKLYAQRELVTIKPFGKITSVEKELADSFPYDETPDQQKAIQEVIENMEGDEPMDRLICGDVGFGKTEVAIRAAMKAVENKTQVAVLAPTTILAQQHFDTFSNRLKKFNVEIDSLSRFKTKSEQKESVAKIKTGELDIIIGTHRLLSPDIEFKNLGLIIIDEEQRFGVRHKETLKKMRVSAHVLTLTATPIPRTLNLSLSLMRDMSVIRTPPTGRQPIETIITPHDDTLIKSSVEKELARGGQIYFLYNRVETINLRANHLKRLIPKAKIGTIHGQMPEETLADTMSKFDNQKLNVLVSTTIIENGLDLPNVNTLIIEDATRFGLAQLYQLRGRVGRGSRKAYAYFLYPQKKLTGESKKRLQAILEARELGSGFQLALRDLEIRGVGNILGREQHGRVNAVGLSLYSRLLSQAVEEMKTGRPIKELRDVLIDLPLPIRIPVSYIKKENERLRVYRELSDIREISDLDERFEELTKKRGTLPVNLKNLYCLLRLKLEAQDTAIESIDTIHVSENGSVKARLVIKFLAMYTPRQIENLLRTNPGWVLGENQIKIDFDRLDPKKWFDDIDAVVKVFQTNKT